MEFKDVVQFVIRHYRILILGLILGGILGLVYTISYPAPYEATSKILISRNKSDKESDFGYLTDQQLIQTYAYILKTQPILDLVNEQINGKVDPDNVRVSQVSDTLILQIAVRDQNPQKAAYIANAFAKAMVTRSNQLQQEQYILEEAGLTSQINSIRTQIDELQAQYDSREITVNQSIIDDVDKQILAYRNEILTLQKEISLIKTPTNLEQESYIIERNTRLDEIQPLLIMYQEIRTNLEYLGRPYTSGSAPEDTTLSRLKTTIDQYQEVNLTLLNSLEKIRLEKVQSEPTVQTIEEAAVPTGRTSLVFVMNPVISGGVGLILAMLLGLVLDRKGMKVANQQQLLKNLGLEVIGAIPPISSWKGNAGIDPNIKVEDEEMKPFHTLRAFLEFHRIRDPYKSLLVTSFAVGDGKSTVASALAVNYALGGDHVVLVDANFTNAGQHSRFNTHNQVGLCDILYGNHEFDNRNLKNTTFENLKLLPVGAYAHISMQLIDPKKMTETIEMAASGQKLVIIDGPPLSDLNAILLASATEKILLVIRTGVYSLEGLEEALKDLGVDQKKILGVVLNEPLSGVANIQSSDTENAADFSRERYYDQKITGEMGLLSEHAHKELDQKHSTSINEMMSELNEAEGMPVNVKGGDEPGVADQQEFVPDSSQERVLSRLFHIPGFVLKKPEKKEDDAASETAGGEVQEPPVKRVEPFLPIDPPKQADCDDCMENENSSVTMDDPYETRSILSWLKFWKKPSDNKSLNSDEPKTEFTESIPNIDEIDEKEFAVDVRSTSNQTDVKEEVSDPVNPEMNPLIEKAKHSLEPIWNQLQRILRPKNEINTVSETVEPVILPIDRDEQMRIAADVVMDVQQRNDVVQEPPTLSKQKRVKKVKIEADTQLEIPLPPEEINRRKARKNVDKGSLSVLDNEAVVGSIPARKGSPKKDQKMEIEPEIPEKGSTKAKSSVRGKIVKAQVSADSAKTEKKVNQTKSASKSKEAKSEPVMKPKERTVKSHKTGSQTPKKDMKKKAAIRQAPRMKSKEENTETNTSKE